MAAVANDSPSHHFFLQGAGGTGKTFLYRAIYGHLQGKSVLCVAFSRIAATLLPNGRTAHSQFKIPLYIDDSTGCNVTWESPLGRLLRNVRQCIASFPMTNCSGVSRLCSDPPGGGPGERARRFFIWRELEVLTLRQNMPAVSMRSSRPVSRSGHEWPNKVARLHPPRIHCRQPV